MTQPELLRGVGLVIGVALITHVVWSFSMVELLASRYDHRIFDVRRWHTDLTRAEASELVAAFATGRLDDDPTTAATVFVGSSFTFGHPWQESIIFSRRYAAMRPREQVLNVSILSAGFEVINRALLCGLAQARRPIDVAILEISSVNAVGRLAAGENDEWIDSCPASSNNGRYLSFALRRPVGIGWLPFAWDPYAYAKPDQAINLAPVPDGYFMPRPAFDALRQRYRALLEATLKAAKRVAHKLVVFPSPVFLTGAAEIGQDAGAIADQIQEILSVCRGHRDVTCLDPSHLSDARDQYYNLTHLNQRGHQSLAQWIASAVPASNVHR